MDKKINKLAVRITKNAFTDDGEGTLRFPNGLTITDDTQQWNGTKYDIESMDISQYPGQLTADHIDSLQNVLGNVFGLRKRVNKVTIDGIKFAINENPLALYTYNMIKAGFIKAFSIETMGPWPDTNNVYKDSVLVGLSVVVMGNNKSAMINNIAYNSIKDAEKLGLDTTQLQNALKYPLDKDKNISHTEKDMKFKTVKNSKDFEITLKYKNAEGQETSVKLAPGQSVDVPAEENANIEEQVTNAVAPKVDEPKPTEPATPDVAEIVKQAMQPLTDQIKDLEQKVFDNGAKEPEFKKAEEAKAKGELDAMDYQEIHGKQINAAWDYLKGGNAEAAKKLNELNAYNLGKLKEKKIVANSVTLADMGNFVISPELLTDIEGRRSDFSSLLSRFTFRETLSLQMAWLTRNGDVNMQEVDMCDVDDGNLKPLSEHTATIHTSNLQELAAVTPVCNAATRFLAVDLLGDVAAGYRTDFDRKRAQLVIVRLQQAVNETGNTKTYATTSDVNALKSYIALLTEDIMNGVLIFNQKTYAELLSREVGAGINDGGIRLFSTGDTGPMLLGIPYIVVPNELMPTLNTAETKSFTVEGSAVTINQAIFYADPSTWSGRTSGGLNYDLSTEAAYEDGDTVKSAFQRNELVLRGSFFRGGAIRDVNKVVGLGSRGVS